MEKSQLPYFIPQAWAAANLSTATIPIPDTAQPGGFASWPTGFGVINATNPTGGGIPPQWADFQGVLYILSAWAQWVQAGGIPVTYNPSFQSEIGGYPDTAIVGSAANPGTYWQSTTDNNTNDPDTGGADWISWPPQPAGSRLAQGECYLEYVSATQLKLVPFNGQNVLVGGTQCQIPASGVPVTNTSVQVFSTGSTSSTTNLGASTAYYIGLLNTSSVLSLAFFPLSAYSHAPDTTAGNIGTEVLTYLGSPLTNYSLVGGCATNSSGQFQAQGTGTASWFNPKPFTLESAEIPNGTTTTTTTPSEVNPLCRVPFFSLGNRSCQFQSSGSGSMESVYETYGIFVGIDGPTPISSGSGLGGVAIVANGAATAGFFVGQTTVSDGSHYATITADVGGAGQTVTFQVGILSGLIQA